MDQNSVLALCILGGLIALMVFAGVTHSRDRVPVASSSVPYLPVPLNPVPAPAPAAPPV